MYWGIGKLTEESGELTEALSAWLLQRFMGRIQQLLGKAIARPVEPHWDGQGPIRQRLKDEVADARAALLYFSKVNFTEEEQADMNFRTATKLDLFMKWGLTGVPSDPLEPENGVNRAETKENGPK